MDDYPQHLERSTDYRDWLTQSESANSDNLFVVTGSLYFISEVRNYLINRKGLKAFSLRRQSDTKDIGYHLATKVYPFK